MISLHFSPLGARSSNADPLAHVVSIAARVEAAFGRPPHVVLDPSGALRLHVQDEPSHALASVATVRSDATTFGFALVAVVMSGPRADDGAIGAVYATVPPQEFTDL